MLRNPDVKRQAIKANEGQCRDVPFTGQVIRSGFVPGERKPLFDQPYVDDRASKQGAAQPAQSFAFTGRGFLPNLFASHAFVTLPEASSTQLENEGVHGREGMLPPAGNLSRLQAGQKLDEGAGGAGSFATVPAFGARTNG